MALPEIVFILGLPASGKTTLGQELTKRLLQKKHKVIHIDADELLHFQITPRQGDFTLDARRERLQFVIRLIHWLSPQLDFIVVSASGQPESAQEELKSHFPNLKFVSLITKRAQLIIRDHKGVYNNKNVLGKDLEFHFPQSPYRELDTSSLGIEDCVRSIMRGL